MSFDTTTALTFVLPNFTHKKINFIRSKYDKAFVRWMPHINFFFPFISRNNFDDVVLKINDLIQKQNLTKFEVNFSGIGFFKNSNGYTFHLKLDEASNDHFQTIFLFLRQALPDVKYERAEFSPHLTLAQCQTQEEFEQMKTMLEDWFEGWINEDYVIMFDALSCIYRSDQTQDKMTIDKQIMLNK